MFCNNEWRSSRMIHLVLVVLALLLPVQSAVAQEAGGRTQEWDQGTIDLIATLPVQHGGRVKPLESVAGLNLLMVNGKRKLKLESGEKLDPAAWLLDCFFFPDQAKAYKSFRIENDAVLMALGLDARKKRDWYTYDELVPAKDKLGAAAMRSSQKEASDRNVVDRQLLKLHQDLRSFESLVGFLEPLRTSFTTGTSESLVEIFGPGDSSGLSTVIANMPRLHELINDQGSGGDEVSAVLRELNSVLATASGGPAVFPPHAESEDSSEWWTIGDLVMRSFGSDADFSSQIELLSAWERLEEKKLDRTAFRAELSELNGLLVGQAETRGEYKHIPLEVKLTRWDLFTNSLVFYLLGFVLLAGTWLAPRVRLLRAGVWASVGVATLLLIAGIVVRCIIRERPPVVSLYDTILFITACVVVVALIMEWMTRLRIGIGVGTVLGVFGMFLAGRYELKEVASAGDTMASVVAVLDTNYYLAIHVTTIAMGYAGGLLAAGIAHIWILGQLFGFRRDDKAFYKSITRMTYGVVCFCLLFSIFGTIMGGVWANDSWGRFWGWDPKENGALLICIWQLLTLHARMGGFIRDRGFAIMAILGGVVVSISWWGVNLLNVGLHSYGFTSGVAMLLLAMWGTEALVILLAGIDHLRRGGGGPPKSIEST